MRYGSVFAPGEGWIFLPRGSLSLERDINMRNASLCGEDGVVGGDMLFGELAVGVCRICFFQMDSSAELATESTKLREEHGLFGNDIG